jgi:hypothetical protein
MKITGGIFLYFIIGLFVPLMALAQKPPKEIPSSLYQQWDKQVLERAWKLADEPYLTKEEKYIVFYINLLRANPKLFKETYVSYFEDSLIIKNRQFLSSLKVDLSKAKPMNMLELEYRLYEEAKKHANEMGKTGKTGHESVLGVSYVERVRHLTQTYKKVYENCQYGYKRGIYVVMDLLIDDGIENLSHRKSLIDENMRYLGVSIQTHAKYKYNAVIEMAYEKKKTN